MTEPRDPGDRDDADTRLDRRLRRSGERWRVEQPGAPRVDVDRLTARRGPRRGLAVPLAAAVAVAVVLLVGLTLLPRHDSSTPSTPSPPTSSPSPGAAVPWLPLPATHPDLEVDARVRPDLGAARNAPACAASDLRAISSGRRLGDTWVVDVSLFLRSGPDCSVIGVPAAVARTVDDRRVSGDEAESVDGRPPYARPVLITPERQAHLQLLWPTGCNDDSANARTAAVALDLGGSGRVVVHDLPLSSRCRIGGRTSPLGFVGVTSVSPYPDLDGGDATPFSSLVVDGEGLDLTAAPGAPVNFSITLTASDDTSLRACPDYTVSIGSVDVVRGLNCAAVPHRDAAGVPYLPAHVPVRFAMQARVPQGLRGEQKLLWTLDGPESSPGANGVVTVTP